MSRTPRKYNLAKVDLLIISSKSYGFQCNPMDVSLNLHVCSSYIHHIYGASITSHTKRLEDHTCHQNPTWRGVKERKTNSSLTVRLQHTQREKDPNLMHSFTAAIYSLQPTD